MTMTTLTGWRPTRATILTAAAGALLALLAVSLPARAERERHHHTHEHGELNSWALHKESTLQKTFTLAATPGGTPPVAGLAQVVEVDNFEGNVVVRSHAGSRVSLVVHQVWSGDSAADIDRGQREVRLDVSQTGGRLRLFVDGPFRSRDGGIDFDGWRKAGYQARFDFELEVPAGVDLVAHTVNGGEVSATGVSGRFDAGNVNGPVTLDQMSGAGSARSVNGDVRVSFARHPAAGCTFKTVNGRIDVSFPPDLAADMSFKTLNGEVFTDFPYTYRNLPASDSTAERHRGRFHYRSRGEFAARIGSGGPELSFSTINGDILIHRLDR